MRFVRASLFALLASLTGCSLVANSVVHNTCTSNAECTGGLVCDPVQRACVSTNAVAAEVLFVALPPANGETGLLPTTLTPGLINSNAQVDLRFAQPRTVEGIVQVPVADDAGAPVDASVDGIDGVPLLATMTF